MTTFPPKSKRTVFNISVHLNPQLARELYTRYTQGTCNLLSAVKSRNVMSKNIRRPTREILEDEFNRLVGEILTIIEAIIPAVEEDLTYIPANSGVETYTSTGIGFNRSTRQNTQREAIKSLVKSSLSRSRQSLVNNLPA